MPLTPLLAGSRVTSSSVALFTTEILFESAWLVASQFFEGKKAEAASWLWPIAPRNWPKKPNPEKSLRLFTPRPFA